jgi:hypothetical protein
MSRYRGTLATLLLVTALTTACARGATLATFTSEERKFSVAYPAGWEIVTLAGDTRVWFLPGGATASPGAATEFVFVRTDDRPGPLSDDEARQLGLNLLPIHGVSGFRRFKDEDGAAWHRFEVTGSSQSGEWASVGLLITGKKTLHYVVCAKPLDRWRAGQKQCDEILKTFRPGPLS